ncbi:MAG: hypothetical protein KDI79_06290 [Anaerolineae bacterium]|nr:hypothetical protein [Anaerolineae bacterium]
MVDHPTNRLTILSDAPDPMINLLDHTSRHVRPYDQPLDYTSGAFDHTIELLDHTSRHV